MTVWPCGRVLDAEGAAPAGFAEVLAVEVIMKPGESRLTVYDGSSYDTFHFSSIK